MLPFAKSLSRAPCWSGRTYTPGENETTIGYGGVLGISNPSTLTLNGSDTERRPLAEMFILPSSKMPEGMERNTNFLPSKMMVCPALGPPAKRATTSYCGVK